MPFTTKCGFTFKPTSFTQLYNTAELKHMGIQHRVPRLIIAKGFIRRRYDGHGGRAGPAPGTAAGTKREH